MGKVTRSSYTSRGSWGKWQEVAIHREGAGWGKWQEVAIHREGAKWVARSRSSYTSRGS